MKENIESWSDLEIWYKPILDKLMAEFCESVEMFRIVEGLKAQDGQHQLVKYLRKVNTIEGLEKNMCIKTIPISERLIEFYLEPNSHLRSQSMKECSGIVVDVSNWKCVAYGHGKIFNHDQDLFSEEKFVPIINWDSVVITKKLNGFDITLFFWEEDWLLSSYFGNSYYTRNYFSFEKQQKKSNQEIIAQIKKSFWELWESRNYKKPTDSSMCYMFSFHPEENMMVLTGARKIENLQEIRVEDVVCDWEKSQPIQLPLTNDPEKNLTILIDYTAPLSIFEYEGVVVTDADFQKIKIISKTYAAMTRIEPFETTNSNKKKLILHVVRTVSDPTKFGKYFVELKGWFNYVHQLLGDHCRQMDEILTSLQGVDDPKQFGTQVSSRSKNGNHASIIFSTKRGGFQSTWDFLRTSPMMDDPKQVVRVENFLFK
eukprot:TRINITY_DN3125_c0_g1_i8.p1 TRINITY_DN3125_c0_g1~~TRINITY_DN3125_c0_g1_i8.p1  ORF type:complete len:428 (-),score=82.19 TRINITY_DN3125_c0_g1_i8:4-1287(-)